MMKMWIAPTALAVALGCAGDKTSGGGVDDTGLAGDDGGADAGGADWSGLASDVGARFEQAVAPGMGVALVVDGELAWSQGFGHANVSTGVQATDETPFMLASVSKAFTAVALMQAVESGAIDLDGDVDDLLDFTVDNPKIDGEQVITARHLATHSSGIRDNWNILEEGYAEGDSPVPLGEWVESYVAEGGSRYDEDGNFYRWGPGEDADYSNSATALAGFLVEASTGVPLDDHSDSEIFAALGMSHTGWHLEDHDEAAVAMPYRRGQSDFVEYGHYGYPDWPDGQLRASSTDVGRFVAAISAGGELDGVRILEQGTVDELLTKQIPDIDGTQAIFWYSERIAGRQVIGHNGGDDGVATEIWLDQATGVGVIVLVNGDWDNQVTPLIADVQQLMFDAGEAGG